MRGEFIDVGGARIYYYAAGTRGAGEPIVLIHGLLTSSHLWNRVVPLMRPGHRVVVPDLVGHGRSDPPATPGQAADLSAQGHAIRLLHLLDGLGIDRACLAAHGTGASVALDVLAAHPDRVTRLCLIGALTQSSPPRLTLTNRLLAPWLATLPQGLLLTVVRHALSRGYLHPAVFVHSIEHYLRPFSTSAGRSTLVAHLYTLTRGTALAPIPVWRAGSTASPPAPSKSRADAPPTTIIWGTDDPLVSSADRQRLHELIPHAQQLLVAGGHFSPEESPEQVAAALTALLATPRAPHPARTAG